MLSAPITLQFRESQVDFTITLCPVTIDGAEAESLGFFIDSDNIANSSRATAGKQEMFR